MLGDVQLDRRDRVEKRQLPQRGDWYAVEFKHGKKSSEAPLMHISLSHMRDEPELK